ncbi:hypothetical protein D3C71_357590 [compost metagenome]
MASSFFSSSGPANSALFTTCVAPGAIFGSVATMATVKRLSPRSFTRNSRRSCSLAGSPLSSQADAK